MLLTKPAAETCREAVTRIMAMNGTSAATLAVPVINSGQTNKAWSMGKVANKSLNARSVESVRSGVYSKLQKSIVLCEIGKRRAIYKMCKDLVWLVYNISI